MGETMCRKLKEWALDWIGRSDVEPSESGIADPIGLIGRAFTVLAALGANLGSPAVGNLVGELNANAAMILKIVIALATVVAVNHVLTAKDSREVISAMRSQTIRRYRYSATDRVLARAIVALAAVMLALNLVPAPEPPRDCDLDATLSWRGAGRPLYLAVSADGPEQRASLATDGSLALRVQSGQLSSYSIGLVWPDGSRSEFGAFSGCAAAAGRNSQDGRATLDLVVR